MAAAAEVLEPCGIPLGLKWPNDLVAYSNSPCEWHGVPGLRREWSEPPQAESETESATTNCGHKVQPTGKLLYKQNGHWKSLVKIGGIIGEQKNGRIILGMGLNIFHAPELPERAIPPASLSSLGAVNIPEMTTLAKKILSAWQNLDKQRTAAFRWPEQGDTIRWEAGSGTCQGWEPDGRLAVRTESGLVLLTSGDVSGLT
jgi:biotin-(acetyl-CoA carboxylase) ligase